MKNMNQEESKGIMHFMNIVLALSDIRQAVKVCKVKKLSKLKTNGDYYVIPDNTIVYDDTTQDVVFEDDTMSIVEMRLHCTPKSLLNTIELLQGEDFELCVRLYKYKTNGISSSKRLAVKHRVTDDKGSHYIKQDPRYDAIEFDVNNKADGAIYYI